MELPKNITQIGEVGRDCKIYVEDYAISYMKQLNRDALDRNMAVALYGRRQEENGIRYYFLYGACRLDSVQREVRHLSQAQLQEIERLRRKYFPESEFMGYRILNGEMIEGIHLCEQGICRYIGGYAQFYEKNDAMLAYMLDVRESPKPEQVDQTKYEAVRKRQEKRRESQGNEDTGMQTGIWREPTAIEENREGNASQDRFPGSSGNSMRLQRMRLAAVAGFAILCLLGIGTFREDELVKGGSADDTGIVAASGAAEQGVEQKDTLMMEDKLEQALLTENQSLASSEEPTEVSVVEESTAETVEESVEELSEESTAGMTAEFEVAKADEAVEAASVSQNNEGAVAYIIQPGDTLISISWRQYGSGVRVTEICELNNISDPDDIKEGQVIMLPQ